MKLLLLLSLILLPSAQAADLPQPAHPSQATVAQAVEESRKWLNMNAEEIASAAYVKITSRCDAEKTLDSLCSCIARESEVQKSLEKYTEKFNFWLKEQYCKAAPK